jgi:hypothetical protein
MNRHSIIAPRTLLYAATVAMLTLSSGCSDGATGPIPGEVKSESELTFVRFATETLGTIPLQASFWAVRGQDRELEMRSLPTPGDDDGEKFLELEIDDETLLRRPDGTAFAEGDSVLITVSVDPGGRFLFDFQPAGLVFNPAEPAELKIRYVLADADYDGDGDVDEDDRDFESLLSIWRRDDAASPFVRLPSLEIDEDELKADLGGFSGFALAN